MVHVWERPHGERVPLAALELGGGAGHQGTRSVSVGGAIVRFLKRRLSTLFAS